MNPVTITSMRECMYKLFLYVVIIALMQITLPGSENSEKETSLKNIELTLKKEKKPFLAGVEAFGLNIGVWAFNRYVSKADFAYISWSTIKSNFNYGFEFDVDRFQTNFFLHPYHGSLYFNTARSNGMNFWQSIPYTVGGSLMWEIAMENTRASGNDLIMTTTGGVLLGETLYRLSSQILDDSKRGFERTAREILAGLLNPVRAFNRLIRGETSRYSEENSYEHSPVHGIFTVGGRGVVNGFEGSFKKTAPLFTLHLIYGDPYVKNESRKPFEFFFIKSALMTGEKKSYFNIMEYALLSGKNITTCKHKCKHLFGFFQYFDFINNEAVQIGSSAVGGGIISKYPISSTANIQTSAHLGLILMGATNTEYFSEELRDYNFGTGYTFKFDAALTDNSFGSIILGYSFYRTYILDGAKGNERLHMFSADYTIPVKGGFGFGFSYFMYKRHSHYRKFEDVKKKITGVRGFISYNF